MSQLTTPTQNPLPTIELTKKAIACHQLGPWGSMTNLAEEFGVSRKTAYQYLNKGHDLLEQALNPPEPPTGKIYADLQVDRTHLERSIIALYTETPNAYRRIVNQIEVLFNCHVSFGLIHQVINEACRRAKAFNNLVDLRLISHVALDEMFYHQTPILGGVDLDSTYIFALEHAAGRTGDDWAKLLRRLKSKQHFDPCVVVKDAGSGLYDGVSRELPQAQQRDDIFHAQMKMSDLRRKLEKKALAALSAEWELEQALNPDLKTQPKPKIKGKKTRKQRKKNRRSLAQQLVHCRKRAEKLVALHDSFEQLCLKARDWMEFVDIEAGKIRTGAECAAGLKSVSTRMKELQDDRVDKVQTT